jgi:biotin synthase
VAGLSFFPSTRELTENGSAQAAFHERAAASTRNQFGRQVFVRAVIEVSNYCRQNCHYCGMRRDDRALQRYRAQADQLAELVLAHRPACVTDLNIQAGEDPIAVREVVLPLIRRVRRETSLGISVCLGTLDAETYQELHAAGASIYIIKFECGNAARYAALEAPGTLAEREAHIRLLASTGWKVSSGFIAGLPGDTPDDLLANLRLAAALPLAGCSVSPFIPGEATPLAGTSAADLNWPLNCIAAMRLMRPDWVIPAVSALNIGHADGYRRGLRAGANLATINLTPESVRDNYIIYKRQRFIMNEERVLTAIAAEGLQPSPRSLAEHYRIRSAPTSNDNLVLTK